MSKKNPVGILGGTFNPIHLGHIQIAHYLLQEYNMEEIRFIPCYQPVHRSKPEVTPQQRLEMVKIAISNHPKLILDLREMHRQTPSYSIDTLQSLRLEFPENPLCMILGSDAFSQINTWKSWLQLLDYAHFMIVNRTNTSSLSAPEVVNLLKKHRTDNIQDIYHSKAGRILVLKMPPITTSATDIRERLHNQLSVAHLLPKGVLEYIRQHNLYTGKNIK